MPKGRWNGEMPHEKLQLLKECVVTHVKVKRRLSHGQDFSSMSEKKGTTKENVKKAYLKEQFGLENEPMGSWPWLRTRIRGI